MTQRGNNRQDVFFVNDDRSVYLNILKQQSEIYGFKVLGYCLMTNHVHIIGVPENKESLFKAIGRTNWRYTQYINRFHNRSGHLWQNRFYSCVLDESHLLAAMAYIERNPVRAGMVRKSWNHKWSSAKAHVERNDESGLLDMKRWNAIIGNTDWRGILVKPDDDEIKVALRSSTSRGRPLGSDGFISKIEKFVGKRVRPLPVGRPKKTKEK